MSVGLRQQLAGCSKFTHGMGATVYGLITKLKYHDISNLRDYYTAFKKFEHFQNKRSKD